MKDAFAGCNPIVNVVYFATVMLVTVCILHPVLLGISFAAGLSFLIVLNGGKTPRFVRFMLIPLMIMAAIVNPAFNHQGVTILTYIGGNPITLESIQYGIAASVMIGSVILLFFCYNEVMDGDKFMYLFGRIIPALSLIFSMTLHFIPEYKKQIGRIADAQRGIGKDVSTGNLFSRIHSGLRMISILVTWALENAVETADSMKARGYGLPGRTSYSNLKLDTRDRILLGVLFALSAVLITFIASGAISIGYYPSYVLNGFGIGACFGYAVFAVICFIPHFLTVYAGFRWRKCIQGMESR